MTARGRPLRRPHPLHAWLLAHGVCRKEFAARIGFSLSSLSRWIQRREPPGNSAKALVFKHTRGAITASDWEG